MFTDVAKVLAASIIRAMSHGVQTGILLGLHAPFKGMPMY
jgi:hypothetical protein